MAYNASNETQTVLLDLEKNQRGDHIKVTKVVNNTSSSVSCDIRNFFTSEDGEVIGTKKGVRVNSEMLPEIMAAMAETLEYNEIEDLITKLQEKLEKLDEE